MMIFIYKCTFVVLLMRVIHCQDSPCPSIFQYKYDKNDLYGRIQVPYPDSQTNLMKFSVEVSIENSHLSSNENLQKNFKFLGNADDFVHKRPLVFRLDFPPWYNIIPKIILISINGFPVCSGDPVQGISTVSTVQFRNTLEIGALNFTKEKLPVEENTNYSQMYHSQFIFINDKNELLNSIDDNSNNFRKIKRSSQSTLDSKPHVENLRFAKLTTSVNVQHETDLKNVREKRFSNICGQSASSIGYENEIQKDTHPWIGALFKRELTSPKLLCSASLITLKLALTAGHCVAPYLDLKLYLTFGKINLLDWFDFDEQIAKVQSVALHPEYRDNVAEADIAILIFSQQLLVSPYVRPVCLWDSDRSLGKIVQEEGFVVDWNKNDSIEITKHLQQNFAVIADENDCFRSSIEIVSNRTICAEIRNNTKFCNSYSGSAFYVLFNGRWILRGIVSILESNEICDLPQYVALLDVTKYIDWINKFL